MTMQSILGNFALILLLLTIGTGLIWLYDRFHYAPKRRRNPVYQLGRFLVFNGRIMRLVLKGDH